VPSPQTLAPVPIEALSTKSPIGLVSVYCIRVKAIDPMRLKFWEPRQTLTDADLPTMLKILYNRGDIDMEFYEVLNESCESIEELAWIMNKTEECASL